MQRSRPFAVKTMVLMTDGIHNTGPNRCSPPRCRPEDIVIHTITFSGDADIRRMQDVAAATGGEHFHADDQKSWSRFSSEIASTLPVMLTE